ncbi:MAG: PKD domain-containing protein, partial [Bacteroidales bacterium]|nr:PKD domain-containing protein [Bacteroidales bacterium]
MKNIILILTLIITSLGTSKAGDCYNFFSYSLEDSLTVTFVGEAYFNGMIIQADSYIWDFGDGTTGDGQVITHTYGPDVYLVTLTTTSTDSITGEPCEAFSSQEVWLENQFDCQAMFFYFPLDSLNPGLNYQFMDISWGSYDSWLWDFGDGTSSTLQNPVHLFADTGVYNVCLTIWDSEGTCQSTYCEEIFIGFYPPGYCDNFFSYYSEENLTFTFTGEAFYNGLPVVADSYLWDFGDGNTAEGISVTHTYANAGTETYEVCLTTLIFIPVFQDSCIAQSCQQVWVNNQIECIASFMTVLDTNNSQPNIFNFYDLSIGDPMAWFWDFGDGSFSTEQNPVHQFFESGNYQVCLTIERGDTTGFGCFDDTCMIVSTANYFNMGGFAFAGDFPLNNPSSTGDTAIALLYRINGGYITPVNSLSFYEFGYYWFTGMIESNYLVKINLTPGSQHYSDYFPTYYHNKLRWDLATVIPMTEDNFDISTILVPTIELENGPGEITGNLTIGGGGFLSARDNISGVEILLFSSDNLPLTFTFTDEMGYFSFTDLPLGTYKLMAESTGMFAIAVTIELTTSNPSASIDLEIFENNVFIIEEPSFEKEIIINKIYPNPVSDNLYVDLHVSSP